MHVMQNATEELKRLEAAFDHVRQGLFSRLHDVVRDQIFVTDGSPPDGADMAEPALAVHSAAHTNGSLAANGDRSIDGIESKV